MRISAINSRILLPLVICAILLVSVAGIVDYLLFKWLLTAFHPLLMLPVLLFLADEVFVVGRTGMLVHYHARHTQAGLRELLVGNGAKQFEALLPYYRHVIARTLKLSAWRWCLLTVIAFFAMCIVLLFGGLSVASVVGLFVGTMLSMVICSVLTLLFSAFMYDRINR